MAGLSFFECGMAVEWRLRDSEPPTQTVPDFQAKLRRTAILYRPDFRPELQSSVRNHRFQKPAFELQRLVPVVPTGESLPTALTLHQGRS